MQIRINGEGIALGVAEVQRSLRQREKYRVTTEDGVTHREVAATYVDFTLQLGNFGKAAYDRLWTLLAGCDEVYTVEVGGEVYTGFFDGISDELLTEDDEGLWWDNLSLSFVAAAPLEV